MPQARTKIDIGAIVKKARVEKQLEGLGRSGGLCKESRNAALNLQERNARADKKVSHFVA